MNGTANDDEFPPVRNQQLAADAHGQAALLLVESLIHGLIARSVITVENAVEIVGVAMVADAEINEESAAPIGRAQSLLEAISGSLMHDL